MTRKQLNIGIEDELNEQIRIFAVRTGQGLSNTIAHLCRIALAQIAEALEERGDGDAFVMGRAGYSGDSVVVVGTEELRQTFNKLVESANGKSSAPMG